MSEITVRDHGPLLVTGDDIVLKDASGKQYELEGKQNIALCRCGASENKPFCDGSHKEGFESTCTAS